MKNLDQLNGILKNSLKEYSGWFNKEKCPSFAALQSKREALEELEKKLLEVPEFESLESEIHKLEMKLNDEVKMLDTKVAKVKRIFYAHGMTPNVIKKVQELVESF